MKKVGTFLLAFLPAILLFIIFICSQFFFMLVLMLATYVHGDINSLYSFVSQIMNYTGELTFTMYVCGGIPAALCYYFGFYRKSMPLKQNKRLRPPSLGLIVLLGLGLYKVIDLFMILVAAITPQAMQDYSELIETSGLVEVSFFSIISTVILAPVVEELVFRGLTLRLFRRSGLSFLLANFLQAVIFGIYHMNLVQGMYAFLIGLVLGFVANHYHTLLASMLLHAVFNFCGTILTQFESALYHSALIQLILIILGILLTVSTLRMIKKDKPKASLSSPNGEPVLRQSPYELQNEESFI